MAANVGGGKLYWASGIDNTGLKKDSQEAVNIVSSMEEKIAKKKMFAGLLKQQKELVAEVEKDVNRIQREYDKMNAGAAKNGRGGKVDELRYANRALAEEQARLLDLQKQSDAANNAQIVSGGNLVGMLGKWLTGLVTVGAALSAFKSIIASTEETSHKFERAITAGKAALELFFKSVATGNFKDFGARLDMATDAAKKYVDDMERIHNLKNQHMIEEAKLDVLIEEQRAKAYGSKDEISDTEKLAAFDEMLRLMRIKADKSIAIATDIQKAISDKTAGVNVLTSEELQFAIENYDKLITYGDRYNAIMKELKTEGKSSISMGTTGGFGLPIPGAPAMKVTEIAPKPSAYYEKLREELKNLPKDAAMVAEISEKLGEVNSAERDAVANAIKDVINAEGQFLVESKRVRRLRASTLNRIDEEMNDKTKATTEYEAALQQKRIDNQLEVEGKLIEIQRDSAEKSRRLADYEYLKTINELNKKKDEQIKKQNEISGGIDTKTGLRTATYDPELHGIDYNQDLDARTAAEKKNTADILKIDEDAKIELAKINREMTDTFLSDIDKQKVAINVKYDDWIKRAKAAGATEDQLAELEKGRAAELELANKDASLKITDYYKKAFGDISTYGYATIKKLSDDTRTIIDTAQQKEIKGKSYYLVSIPDIDAEGKAVQRNVTLTIEEFNALQDKYNALNKLTREKNPFKGMADSFDNIVKAMKSSSKEDFSDALEVFGKSTQDAIKWVDELGDSLGDLFGSDVKDDVKILTDLASGATDLGIGIGRIAAGDYVGGIQQAVKGIAKLFTTLTQGNKKYKEDTKKFLQEMIELTLKYKNVLIDLIQAQEGTFSSVFITDYSNTILQASTAIKEAQTAIDKIFEGDKSHGSRASSLSSLIEGTGSGTDDLVNYLDNLQIQIGTTRKKFLGITVGSKPVWGSLLDQYPELIDANGEFNVSIAETILAMESIPQATKNGLEALIAYENQVQESQDAIKSAVQSMAGFISDDLRTALMSAWDDGTDAFKAFELSVTQGLKTIVSQMLYNAIFAKSFKELEDNITQSFGLGGDKSIVDDLAKFFQQAPQLVEAWTAGMTEAQKQSLQAGFDWSKLNQKEETGLAGSIQQQITEQTAGVLAGQINAMQINVIEQLRTFKESVVYQKQIADNTLRTADILLLISNRASSSDSLRASGL